MMNYDEKEEECNDEDLNAMKMLEIAAAGSGGRMWMRTIM